MPNDGPVRRMHREGYERSRREREQNTPRTRSRDENQELRTRAAYKPGAGPRASFGKARIRGLAEITHAIRCRQESGARKGEQRSLEDRRDPGCLAERKVHAAVSMSATAMLSGVFF